jgi:beta-galactosidase
MFFDHLPSDYWGHINFNGESYGWNNWGDVMTANEGTEIWGSYADQFYKNSTAVTHRKLGKGSVTYIGVDTDDGKLEKAVMQRIYREANVGIEDLPAGVLLEYLFFSQIRNCFCALSL